MGFSLGFGFGFAGFRGERGGIRKGKVGGLLGYIGLIRGVHEIWIFCICLFIF